jgi:hypothetical protein
MNLRRWLPRDWIDWMLIAVALLALLGLLRGRHGA